MYIEEEGAKSSIEKDPTRSFSSSRNRVQVLTRFEELWIWSSSEVNELYISIGRGAEVV